MTPGHVEMLDMTRRAEKAERELATALAIRGEAVKARKDAEAREDTAERERDEAATHAVEKHRELQRELDAQVNANVELHSRAEAAEHNFAVEHDALEKAERERDEALGELAKRVAQLNESNGQIMRVRALVAKAEDADDWVSADELEAALGDSI